MPWRYARNIGNIYVAGGVDIHIFKQKYEKIRLSLSHSLEVMG